MTSCCDAGTLELDAVFLSRRSTPWSFLARKHSGEWIKVSASPVKGTTEAAVLRALGQRYGGNVPRVLGACESCGAIEMADVGIAAVAPDFEHASMLCAEMCRFLLGSAAFGALPLVSPESLAQALSSIARTDSRLVEAAARVKGIAEASSIEDWTTEVIHGDFHRGNVHRSLAGEIVILDWSDSARMLVPPRSSATFGLTCQLMLQAKGLCDLFEATDVELARLHDPQHLELLKHSATQAVTTTLVRLGASDPVPSTVVR